MSRPPLGVHLRGPALWIVWQTTRPQLEMRLAQLERDPGVDPAVVRQLRGVLADLELGAQLFRDWQAVRNVADSAEVSVGGSGAGSEYPYRWGVAKVAAELNCGPRWVTTLCRTGQLAAIKQGREWRIDPSSAKDFQRREVA